MSSFEFVFTLFGLMLGFSLAEMLSGLVRVLKARRAVAIGWLTPLLATFVMLDLTSFWANAWDIRESIPATYGILVLGLVASGIYFLAASLLFPERPEECARLDDHYYLRRRPVLAGIALCNGAVIVATALVLPALLASPQALITHGLYYAMIALAAFARPRWLNIGALAILVLLYLYYAVLTLALAQA